MDSLEDAAGLEAVLAVRGQTVVLFKHSTRCPISAAAKGEFEEFAATAPAGVRCVFLDLLMHRDLSNEIARRLNVGHESPQALILREGRPVAVLNHEAVTAAALRAQAASKHAGPSGTR